MSSSAHVKIQNNTPKIRHVLVKLPLMGLKFTKICETLRRMEASPWDTSCKVTLLKDKKFIESSQTSVRGG